MLKRVYHVRLYGDISTTSFTGLRTILKKRLLYRPLALAISVNSSGGSIVGAKNIARHINQFATDYELPLYTFADDICLGAANIILASGWKNPYSLLGEFSSSMHHLSFENALKKLDIDVTVLKEGKNKDRLSNLTNIGESEKELMRRIVETQENDIRQEVLNYRLKGFRRKRLDPNEAGQLLFDGNNSVEDFKKLGYIDDISTLHEVIEKDFGVGTRVLELNINSIASAFTRTSISIN